MNENRGCILGEFYLFTVTALAIAVVYYIGARNTRDTLTKGTKGISDVTKIMLGYRDAVDSTLVTEEPVYYEPPGVPKLSERIMRYYDDK